MTTNRTPISFAQAADGSDILAPTGTVWIRITGWNPGQAGRPRFIFLDGATEPFGVQPDASPSALACLPSGEYRGEFIDSAGRKIGASFPFTIQHLGQEPGGEKVNDKLDINPVLQQVIDRLEARVDSLVGTIEKLVNTNTSVANKAMDTQVEVVKVMPEAMQATAKLIASANGTGQLAEAANELQTIWENAPTGEGNIEAVLNSPVVVGAAAALQKYMAKAAENGAEAVASAGSRRRGQNMAERAARIAAAVDDAAERRAAMARSRA